MNQKHFEFTGTPGGYFVAALISGITAYIPIFGWPIGFNYMNNWLADNVLIDGRKVKYSAEYGETLKFLFINMLLVIITFGIYSFWFAIKSYKFIAAHTTFVDAVTAAPVQSMNTPAPVLQPEVPSMPEAPTMPTPEPPMPPASTPIQ